LIAGVNCLKLGQSWTLNGEDRDKIIRRVHSVKEAMVVVQRQTTLRIKVDALTTATCRILPDLGEDSGCGTGECNHFIAGCDVCHCKHGAGFIFRWSLLDGRAAIPLAREIRSDALLLS
jgi:hypothetical protein